jgi:limonene-1,2-epoxide hydrolase
MRRLGVLAGLVIAIMALGAAGNRSSARAQQAPDIRTVVEAYKQALMQLDGPAVAALFDDNIILSNFGETAKGKAEAIALLGEAIAAHPHLSVTLGDTVYVLNTAIEREAFSSDVTRAAGVSRVMGIETIVVLNGKIVSYTAVPDLNDPETVRFIEFAAQR